MLGHFSMAHAVVNLKVEERGFKLDPRCLYTSKEKWRSNVQCLQLKCICILKIHWPKVVRVVEPGLITDSKPEVRRHWKSRWTKTSDFVSMRIGCHDACLFGYEFRWIYSAKCREGRLPTWHEASCEYAFDTLLTWLKLNERNIAVLKDESIPHRFPQWDPRCNSK